MRQWISENRDLLKPPVGNKNLYADAGDYIVMVVGGPNARKDYHYNETEELFYQLEGDTLKLCHGTPDKKRPKKFESTAGSGLTYSVWKRSKS